MKMKACFHHHDGVHFIRFNDDSVAIVKFAHEDVHGKDDEQLIDLLDVGKYEWMHKIPDGMQWISITASMGSNNYDIAKKLFYDES